MSLKDQIEKEIMSEPKKTLANVPRSKENLLSSGSTLINLACSGKSYGAFLKGCYYLLVGDSASGKTWIVTTSLAELVLNPGFADYRFIYDDIERGNLIDLRKFFGKRAANKIEPPALDEDGNAKPSITIEDFYFNVDDALKGPPFVYVCDSMDGLSSEAEKELFQTNKKKYRKGKELQGSYGDGKAKFNSQNLRKLTSDIRKHGSILIILAQTRTLLNAGPFQDSKTRSGGTALRFYATAELWTSLAGQIKKEVRKKQRTIGNKVQVKIKKNRHTGLTSVVTTAIYHSYGIDDVGSCIDFLLQENWWKKKGGKIIAGDFGMLSREKLIRECEKDVEGMRSEVVKCWKAIATESALERKPRYV